MTTPSKIRSVSIEPGGAEVRLPTGALLLDAVHTAGIPLHAVCGAKGTCGKCRIVVLSGTPSPPTKTEEDILSQEDLDAGVRLACQARVAQSDLRIEIPPSSLLPEEDGLTDSRRNDMRPDPATRLLHVKLPEPSLQDQRPDAARLSQTLGLPASRNLDLIRALPGILRRNAYSLDVLVHRDSVIAVLDPHPGRSPLGFAVDLGTTTIAAELFDLESGESLGTAAASNPQAVAGADVISRIEYIRSRPDGLQRLNKLVTEALLHLCRRLLDSSGRPSHNVAEILVAGNPTMLHLLLGVDPSAIASVPFTPAFNEEIVLRSEKLGLGFCPGAILSCLPSISGYVGADIVAGLLAVNRIEDIQLPALFIDVGTNGEICLLTGSETLCCATAAGPAFEGAKISCGSRAVPGAISKVRFHTGALEVKTIQDAPPQSICGSGLIDAIAALLDAGLLEPNGALPHPEDIKDPSLRPLLVNAPSGDPAVQLAPGVALSQRDIRELQLAKGAVQAGCRILLSEAGLAPSQIAKVYLGGAFGSFIDPRNAVRTGLVPPEFTPAMLDFLGNTSLAGAGAALLSVEARDEAARLAETAKYVELSGRADFQTTFAEAMFFPLGTP